MHLRHHSLRESLHRLREADAGAAQQLACALGRETRLQPRHQRNQLLHACPTRQDRHVGDVAKRFQQPHTLPVWVQSQDLQAALHRQQAHQGLEQRGLSRTVVPDQPHDAPWGDHEVDPLQRRLVPMPHAQAAGLDQEIHRLFSLSFIEGSTVRRATRGSTTGSDETSWQRHGLSVRKTNCRPRCCTRNCSPCDAQRRVGPCRRRSLPAGQHWRPANRESS